MIGRMSRKSSCQSSVGRHGGVRAVTVVAIVGAVEVVVDGATQMASLGA